MWRIITVLIILVSAIAFSQDDLFVDSTPEEVPFPNVALEYDPQFKDDFLDIEGSNINDFPTSALIAESHDLWNARDLFRREQSFSGLAGGENIASIYHVTLYPQARFLVSKVFGHVGVPLRFPLYDNGKNISPGERAHGFLSAKKLFLPRARDFRSFWDTQRLVRHFEFTYDLFKLSLQRHLAMTMANGELLKHMSPEGFYDQDYLFLTSRIAMEKLSVDALVGPLLKAEMLALSSRFTPLYGIDAPAFVRNLNFDVTYVNDFFAPNLTVMDGDSYLLDNERRMIKRKTGTAQGLVVGGASLSNPTGWLSLKPYVSYGHLWLTGLKSRAGDLPTSYGFGFHMGHDAIFSFVPGTKRSILLLKTEARLFSRGYWPGYFGPTYLIDRVVLNEQVKGVTPISKSELLGDRGDGRFRVGYVVELAYSFLDMISSSAGYESAHSFAGGAQIAPMRKFYFNTTFFGLDIFKFHLGFQATSISQMKELFDFEKSRALLSLRGQLKVLPFLYFDTWVKHSFGINDMFNKAAHEGDSKVYMTNFAESKSLNFGLGVEFAMTF